MPPNMGPPPTMGPPGSTPSLAPGKMSLGGGRHDQPAKGSMMATLDLEDADFPSPAEAKGVSRPASGGESPGAKGGASGEGMFGNDFGSAGSLGGQSSTSRARVRLPHCAHLVIWMRSFQRR